MTRCADRRSLTVLSDTLGFREPPRLLGDTLRFPSPKRTPFAVIVARPGSAAFSVFVNFRIFRRPPAYYHNFRDLILVVIRFVSCFFFRHDKRSPAALPRPPASVIFFFTVSPPINHFVRRPSPSLSGAVTIL